MDNLILISGYAASGKSTLLKFMGGINGGKQVSICLFPERPKISTDITLVLVDGFIYSQEEFQYYIAKAKKYPNLKFILFSQDSVVCSDVVNIKLTR